MESKFKINTKTTGFGSPARAYVTERLDTNQLLIRDSLTTYFFKWEGESIFNLEKGDYLIIDRGIEPLPDDVVLYSEETKLSLNYFKNIPKEDLWGTLTWKLSPIKK